MQTQTDIRRILDERGLSPRKSLGQNFLVDQNLLSRLVEASGVGPGDVALEVGPGTGVLTERLLERVAAVVGCELDEGLAAFLAERFEGEAREGRFTLVRGDCLERKGEINAEVARALGERGFVLVANLPYGVGTTLLATLLIEHPECRGMWVTIQREVADRLLAPPGGKEYGEVSVIAGAMATMRRLATLPPECFWPRPKVTSAMVEIVRRPAPLTDDPRALARTTRILFQKRRKQIGAILREAAKGGLVSARLAEPGAALPAGIDGAMRPEQLTVEQFVALAGAIVR